MYNVLSKIRLVSLIIKKMNEFYIIEINKNLYYFNFNYFHKFIEKVCSQIFFSRLII
jgi:hypothetical protein